MENVIEKKANELGYSLKDTDYVVIPNSILGNIKIRQTVLAPEDEIYIHPLIMGYILNNDSLNHLVDVFIHKAEKKG